MTLHPQVVATGVFLKICDELFASVLKTVLGVGLFRIYKKGMRPRYTENSMSEQKNFLAQVHQLVVWLHDSKLTDVQTHKNVLEAEYSTNFFKWLTVRFRTKHGRKENGLRHGKTLQDREKSFDTTPHMWINSLKEACKCLHEVRYRDTCRLLVIEMIAHGSPDVPVPHVPYYDEMGVFNIAFICAKHDADTNAYHEIYVTDVAERSTYGVIGSKCLWGGIDSVGQCVEASDLDHYHNDQFVHEGHDLHGTPMITDCGTFQDDMQSDYFALHDVNNQLLLKVHRIASVPAAVHTQTLKERDPVEFNKKKARYLTLLRDLGKSLKP